jgi:3-oxoacyl-[acyl-carrier-protein] synthase-3
MLRSRIVGTGHYLPKNVVTNTDLEKFMDTTDEWIRQRTGILQRHVAGDDEAVSDMGAEAATRALDKAGIPPEEVDCVVCATMTPDYLCPSAASLVQHKLGATKAAAFDLNAACSGFVYGLEIANAYIQAGIHNTVVVLGAEVLSVRLDWQKRDTAVLFGDGAGAAVLRGDRGDRGIICTFTRSDGSAHELLHIPAGGTKQAVTPENINSVNRGIVMDGRGLYKRAVYAFGEATAEALARANLRAEDIDIFVPHQANMRIITAAAERIGLPEEKIFTNLDRVANTSAASIPIALDDAVQRGLIKDHDVVLLAAFGAGLTYASAVVRW